MKIPAALGRRRVLTDGDAFFNDLGGNEDQEFSLVVLLGIGSEQCSEYRNITQQRNLGHIVPHRLFINAT